MFLLAGQGAVESGDLQNALYFWRRAEGELGDEPELADLLVAGEVLQRGVDLPPEVLDDLVGYRPGIDTELVVAAGSQGTADHSGHQAGGGGAGGGGAFSDANPHPNTDTHT